MPTAEELAAALRQYAGTPPAPPAAVVRARARRIRARRRFGRLAMLVAAVGAVAAGTVLGGSSWQRAERSTMVLRTDGAPTAVEVGDATAALLDALRRDDHDRAAELLRGGADPDRSARYGITPLMVAAIRGDVSSTRLLLDAGAHMRITDGYGRTALVLAAQYGHARVIEVLLESGASAETRVFGTGVTPIMLAASAGAPAAVHVLVTSGADVDASDAIGRSVLHHALDAADPRPVVTLLLEAGATVDGLDEATAPASLDDVLAALRRTDPDPW
jgi:hypothetical protein